MELVVHFLHRLKKDNAEEKNLKIRILKAEKEKEINIFRIPILFSTGTELKREKQNETFWSKIIFTCYFQPSKPVLTLFHQLFRLRYTSLVRVYFHQQTTMYR